MPAVSPTLWVAALTLCLPVVSPFAASAFLVVASIWRLKRPGSLLGESTFLTSSWPVGVDLRVLVIVHTTSAPSATDTLSGPASEPLASTAPVPPSSLQTIAEV